MQGLVARSDELKRLSDAAGRKPGFSRPRVQFRAYQTALRLARVPCDERDAKDLGLANETVMATRALQPWGRPNVRSELEASNMEAAYRNAVETKLSAEMARRQRPITHWAEFAAVIAFMESGTCFDRAVLAMALHAPKLQPGERLVVMRQKDVFNPHCWLEWQRPGRPSLKIDVWGEVPALMLDHSEKGKDPRQTEPVPGAWHCDFETRTQGLEAFHRTRVHLAADYADFVAAELQKLREKKPLIPPQAQALLTEPQAVIDPEFAEMVRNKLQESPDASPSSSFASEGTAARSAPQSALHIRLQHEIRLAGELREEANLKESAQRAAEVMALVEDLRKVPQNFS